MQRIDEKCNPIYAPATIEFVTVAAEYCAYLEQSEGRDKATFMSTMLKLMPLIYVKAQLLPCVETCGDFLPDDRVSEDDYNWIQTLVHHIVSPDDEYEALANQGGETHWQSISENMADIYQALRNFVQAYQIGVDDCMRDALWLVRDQFDIFWGQCLVDTLAHMHPLHYRAAL